MVYGVAVLVKSEGKQVGTRWRYSGMKNNVQLACLSQRGGCMSDAVCFSV